jgi:hypothetical protein
MTNKNYIRRQTKTTESKINFAGKQKTAENVANFTGKQKPPKISLIFGKMFSAAGNHRK